MKSKTFVQQQMLGQDGVQNVVTFSSQHVQDLLDSEMKQRAAKPHASEQIVGQNVW